MPLFYNKNKMQKDFDSIEKKEDEKKMQRIKKPPVLDESGK
jgi:hypothetical protein